MSIVNERGCREACSEDCDDNGREEFGVVIRSPQVSLLEAPVLPKDHDLSGDHSKSQSKSHLKNASKQTFKNRPAKNCFSPSNSDVNTEISPATLRYSAMSLLARREHSRFELKQKLSQRFIGCQRGSDEEGGHDAGQVDLAQLIDTVIQQLADEALQCDARFTEAFIAMRVRKGQGPIRIGKELEQRRVNDGLIEAGLEDYSEQWIALARKVHAKKYPRCQPSKVSPKDKAKQIRFLQYRGFSGDQIQAIWKES